MIFTIRYRMTAEFRRLHNIEDATASRHLKARGLRIPKKGL
jgi:hypothetical protein